MSYTYNYSLAFDALKNTREQLSTNYTTRDYVSAMDTLLFNAVEPLTMTCVFSDTFLAAVAAWYSSNAKRRISRLDKAEFFGLVSQMLISTDPRQKFEYIKRMQLERTILFFMVDSWLQVLDGYTRAVSEYAATKNPQRRDEMTEYETVVGRRRDPPMSLFAAIRNAKFWLQQFLDLKEMILEKYSRLIITTAQKDYKRLGQAVHLNDLIQNYVVTSSRALDKCDFKQGTLTSYIQLWLKSACSKSVRTDSIDDSVGAGDTGQQTYQRISEPSTDDHYAEELAEEDGAEYHDPNTDEIQHVRYLLKLVDPTGIYRLATGIQEVLLPHELTAGRKHHA